MGIISHNPLEKEKRRKWERNEKKYNVENVMHKIRTSGRGDRYPFVTVVVVVPGSHYSRYQDGALVYI